MSRVVPKHLQLDRTLKLPGHADWPIISFMVVLHILAFISIPYVTWTAVAVMLVMYALTACVGITFCYHRLLTHRAFKAHKVVERASAICGVLALQGSPLEWVGHHRMHHAYGDTAYDPHNARAGFWHSHWGWLFKVVPEFDQPGRIERFGRDIVADPFLSTIGRGWAQIGLQVTLGLILWASFGFWVMMWGIFVRLVLVYHSTWLVNSAAHIWGYRNFALVDDSSQNNWFVAFLTFGEGWHNNHHAYPEVAPAGYRWWEIDLTYGLIRVLRAAGLIWDVRQYPKDAKRAGFGVQDSDILAEAEADSAMVASV
jgi:fatty-acid desaturase